MTVRLATRMLPFAVLAVIASPAVAQASATVREASAAAPSPSRVRNAVSSAKRSKRLWATINICDTRHHPNTLGIRGQVPALGFPASISIAINVDFWNPTSKRFKPDPGASKLIRLSNVSQGIHQQGASFRFGPAAGRFRGRARFVWKRRGKVLGKTDRVTTGGHRDADFGDPRGFSAATCTIK